MGRELKRVPLDFNWPINKIWEGFVNPHWEKSKECTKCGGNGLSKFAAGIADQWYGKAPFDPVETGSKPFTWMHPAVLAFAQRNVERDPQIRHGQLEKVFSIAAEAKRLSDLWDKGLCHHLSQDDVHALVDAGRLMDFTHRPRTKEQAEDLAKQEKQKYWMEEPNGYVPTAAEVNEWSLCGFGHDAINRLIVIEDRCKRANKPHYCDRCNGDGREWPDAATKDAYERWTKTDPPTGEGYQIWENVSEGSPISPVFAEPEQLAQWMANHNRGVDEGTTKKQWLNFIVGPGWAPSLVVHNSPRGCDVKTGVQAG